MARFTARLAMGENLDRKVTIIVLSDIYQATDTVVVQVYSLLSRTCGSL